MASLLWTALAAMLVFSKVDGQTMGGSPIVCPVDKTTFFFRSASPQGHVYHLSTFYSDSLAAEFACDNIGTRLARITSQDDFDNIVSFMNTVTSYEDMFIHIAGVRDGAVFKFNNGQDVFFPSNMQPSINPNENCLAIKIRQGAIHLSSVRCKDFPRRFMCEEI